jgi:hypothetical protein
MDDSGSIPGWGKIFFSTQQRTDRIWAQVNKTQIYCSSPLYSVMAWFLSNVPMEDEGSEFESR